MAYLFLLTSIITEVFASTMLKLSNGFTKKLPIVGVIVGYGLCFYLLSLTLLELPLGFSYAVWSGLGTILTAVMGVVLFGEKINRQGLFGIALLLIGIILLNISK